MPGSPAETPSNGKVRTAEPLKANQPADFARYFWCLHGCQKIRGHTVPEIGVVHRKLFREQFGATRRGVHAIDNSCAGTSAANPKSIAHQSFGSTPGIERHRMAKSQTTPSFQKRDRQISCYCPRKCLRHFLCCCYRPGSATNSFL